MSYSTSLASSLFGHPPSAHTNPAALAFFLFLEYAKHTSVSRPLNLLLHLPRTLFLRFLRLLLHIIHSLLRCHLKVMPSWAMDRKQYRALQLVHHSLFPWLCFIFVHSFYHLLAYFMIVFHYLPCILEALFCLPVSSATRTCLPFDGNSIHIFNTLLNHRDCTYWQDLHILKTIVGLTEEKMKHLPNLSYLSRQF